MRHGIHIFLITLLFLFACKDKVKKFDGFTQKELEYLLSSSGGKVWERISRFEDGQEMQLEPCEAENYLLLYAGDVGKPKKLVYAYNPETCDSADFCMLHPDFCAADTAMCQTDPDFCTDLGDGILYIGSWYAKAPFIDNARSDTLVFQINNEDQSIFVEQISSQFVTFRYKRSSNNQPEIMENYQYLAPENQ